MHRRCKR